jgi:hypothetical protein
VRAFVGATGILNFFASTAHLVFIFRLCSTLRDLLLSFRALARIFVPLLGSALLILPLSSVLSLVFRFIGSSEQIYFSIMLFFDYIHLFFCRTTQSDFS